jgi:hypothetical protein
MHEPQRMTDDHRSEQGSESNEEQQGAHRQGHSGDAGVAFRKRYHESENRPPGQVIDHAGCEHRLSDVAPHQAQVEEYRRQHWDGRHGHRSRQEEREDDALIGVTDEINREPPPKQQPAGKWNDQAPKCDSGRRTGSSTDQFQICLEAGDHQKQHGTQHRDDLEKPGLASVCGQPCAGNAGCDRPQDRRTENDARQDLTSHGRLTDTLGDLTEEPGNGQQHSDLEDQL